MKTSELLNLMSSPTKNTVAYRAWLLANISHKSQNGVFTISNGEMKRYNVMICKVENNCLLINIPSNNTITKEYWQKNYNREYTGTPILQRADAHAVNKINEVLRSLFPEVCCLLLTYKPNQYYKQNGSIEMIIKKNGHEAKTIELKMDNVYHIPLNSEEEKNVIHI